MSQYDLQPGKRYRFVVEGHVWQDHSGHINICDSPPVSTPMSEVNPGTFYLGPIGDSMQIQDSMLVDEPEPVPDYPPGALFEYGQQHSHKVILVYDPTHDLPWEIIGTGGRRRPDSTIDRRYLTRLYREREA